MSSLQTPYSLLEAEIALYKVDADTLSTGVAITTPVCVGSCLADLTIDTRHPEEDPRAFADTIGLYHRTDIDHTITASFTHGQYLMDGAYQFPPLDARYILTVLWHDTATGDWLKLQINDVTIPSRNLSTGGAATHSQDKAITFHGRSLEPTTGNSLTGSPATTTHAAIPVTPAPALTPTALGTLWYIGQLISFPTHTYNFVTDTWTTLPANLTAGGAPIAVDLQANQIDIIDLTTTTTSTALTWAGTTANLKAGGQAYVYGADTSGIFGTTETHWIEFRALGSTYFGLGSNGNLAIPALQENAGPLAPIPFDAAILGILTFTPQYLHVNTTLVES